MIRKFCTQCGSPRTRDTKGPSAGLCSKCVRNLKIEVECVLCKGKREILFNTYRDYGGNFCPSCAASEAKKQKTVFRMVELTCVTEGCGKKFTTRYSNSQDLRFSGQCPDCRTNTRKIQKRLYRKREEEKKNLVTLNIHGCTIAPRDSFALRSGNMKGRCTPYLECKYGFLAPYLGVPKSEECSHVIGLLLWEGWKVIKRTEDHRLPSGVIHELLVSELKEINLLNEAYGV